MKYLIDLSDKRNVFVFKSLQSLGKNVGIFESGNFSKIKFNEISNDKNNILIFSPAKKLSEIEIEEFPKNSIIFGGNQQNEILKIFKIKNLKYINMLENEKFVIENAKLTAEGILALLIKSTEKSIFKNKIIILGSGRVGMATATLLNKLDLNVDIAIFHQNKLATSSFCCKNVVLSEELSEQLSKYDVIINTVPFKVLENELLSKINKNTIILEIASTSCLNIECLKNFKFKYILSPALPQRFSAESAAEIMLDLILKHSKEYEFREENIKKK